MTWLIKIRDGNWLDLCSPFAFQFMCTIKDDIIYCENVFGGGEIWNLQLVGRPVRLLKHYLLTIL